MDMYDEWNQGSRVCPVCGRTEDNPAMRYCTVCGNQLITETPYREPAADELITEELSDREQWSAPPVRRGFGSMFASTVFSVFFVIFTVSLVIILYLSALGKSAPVPALLTLNGVELSDYLATWYPTALAALLVVIPLLLIFLANLKQIRFFFRCMGIADMAAAVLLLALGLGAKPLFVCLPEALRDFTAGSAETFGSLAVVSAILLVVLGAICFSVYAMILILKGDRHE